MSSCSPATRRPGCCPPSRSPSAPCCDAPAWPVPARLPRTWPPRRRPSSLRCPSRRSGHGSSWAGRPLPPASPPRPRNGASDMPAPASSSVPRSRRSRRFARRCCGKPRTPRPRSACCTVLTTRPRSTPRPSSRTTASGRSPRRPRLCRCTAATATWRSTGSSGLSATRSRCERRPMPTAALGPPPPCWPGTRPGAQTSV